MSSEGMQAKKMSYADMGSFFENMAMMVKAGITASEAVGLLKEEAAAEDAALSAVYSSMASGMESGSSLADAMKDSGAFPGYAVDMIGASEYTGRLEDTLFHLSDYYRMEESMKNTFVSAVRYPIILLLMVIVILAVMLKMVFPVFYKVYESLTGSLSASSFKYINASFAICRVLMIVMIVIVVLMLIGVWMWKNGRSGAVRAMLSKIRSFRELFDNLDLYRFTSCFDMFISSGEMQDEALKKSLSVVTGDELKAKLERCIQKTDEGLSFSQAAFEEKLYDSINNRMLIPAERSGMLDAVLKKILVTLKDNNDKHIARIAGTVEPMLTGFLMITIGLMLVSLMIPLIGIMNSIG